MNTTPIFAGTTDEVCKFLHIGRTTLWRYRKERPEAFRKLGKMIFILTL